MRARCGESGHRAPPSYPRRSALAENELLPLSDRQLDRSLLGLLLAPLDLDLDRSRRDDLLRVPSGRNAVPRDDGASAQDLVLEVTLAPRVSDAERGSRL